MNKIYHLCNSYALKLLILTLLVSGNSYATDYIFNGTLTPAFGAFPNQAFTPSNGDTLEVQSGSMHLDIASLGTIITSSNGVSYSATIESGATVINTMPSGNSAAIVLDASAGSNITINNKGTIEKAAAANAIFINNSNSSNRVSIINSGSINGSMFLKNVNLYIDGAGNAAGQIVPNNTTSIFIGENSAATYTINFPTNNFDAINVIDGTLNINARLRDMNGDFNTSSNTTTNINARVAASGNLNNDGNIIIASNLLIEFGFGMVDNNGSISINAAGNLAFDNMSNNGDVILYGAKLESYNIGVTPNVINNGNITANSSSQIISGMSNNGMLNVYGTLSGLNNLTNSGTINLQGDLNMAGYTFANTGILMVSGNRAINSTAIVSSGSQNYLITDATTYDSLTSTGSINLSDGTVNITSSFVGPAGSTFTWDILTGTSITTNGGTNINIPTSGTLGAWSDQIINGNILRLSYVRGGIPFIPPPGVTEQIANVLLEMSNNVTNSGQAALLAAVNSATTQNQYNYILENLQANTTTSGVTIAMQNIGFNKIEARIASVKTRNNTVKNNANTATSGIATGDLTYNASMWLSGLGSISRQNATGENQGYRAKILGGILGFDFNAKNDDFYGLALGLSNANVYALVNTTNKTRILGYNLMIYGANVLPYDYFAEWIVSGVINKNYGVRVFGINGTDLSASASYRGAIGGVKVNVGKMYDANGMFNLSPIATAQYVLVHQPAYDEDNSVAALHITTKTNQSILTLGGGVRLGVLNNAWINGTPELSAMLTYDVISPQQVTTANFVVGSNSFIATSSTARLALKLGADCSFNVYKNLDLQFGYNYEVRSGYYDNFGEVKFRYLF